MIFGTREPRKPGKASEADIRERMRALRPMLAEELRAIVAEALEDEQVACILFDVRPEFAFSEFPVTVETYDRDLHAHEGSVHLRELLRGVTFLDPEAYDRLAPYDWYGDDAFPQIVDRVLAEEFRREWSRLMDAAPRIRAYIGAIATDEKTREPRPSQVLNLGTGEVETLNVTWS